MKEKHDRKSRPIRLIKNIQGVIKAQRTAFKTFKNTLLETNEKASQFARNKVKRKMRVSSEVRN